MHSQADSTSSKQPAPKRKEKRSRFASSTTVKDPLSGVTATPTPPSPHLKDAATTSAAPAAAVSVLRARLAERKAAAPSNKISSENPSIAKATNIQIENGLHLHNPTGKVSVLGEPPAKKRRRTSRFAQAKVIDRPSLTTATTSAEVHVSAGATEMARPMPQESASVSKNFSVSTARPARSVWSTDVAPSSSALAQQTMKGPPTTFDVTAIPIAPPKTLRINQKAEKKQKLASVLKISEKDLLDTNPQSNPYFDPALKKPTRPPRTLRKDFNFVEQGTIAAQAQEERKRAVVEARRTEFTDRLTDNAAQTSNLPILPPRAEDLTLDTVAEVPLVEWWDLPFIARSNTSAEANGVDKMTDENDKQPIQLREERITHYIHHPQRIEPAKPQKAAPVIPLMLTKKESKKLRRQRRMESQKEQQEMIAAGLVPPPPPKVKLSNMMRVLAAETSADPTKVEAEVRAQVEARRLKHEADNEERKKSGEERREKARQKRKEDRDAGLHAAVFRVANLSNALHRFKIDRNAKQLDLTGVMALFPGCNVVIVEGGAKALRKYKALMLRRINWDDSAPAENAKKEDAEIVKVKLEDEIKEDKESIQDKEQHTSLQVSPCVMVWEGVISSTSFKSFETKRMKNEATCRAMFSEHHVEHYWDLCLQASPVGNEKLGVREM